MTRHAHAKLDAIRDGASLYHVCEACGSTCDLDEVRDDGVRVYRCRNAHCPVRVSIVVPAKKASA